MRPDGRELGEFRTTTLNIGKKCISVHYIAQLPENVESSQFSKIFRIFTPIEGK